nr:hypothetical protein [Candidatus Paceibacterota bacterium]
HLVLLDVPQYKDIRTVVPIVDMLEKIFQVLYGNSIVRLLQSPAQHTGGGMFGFGSRDGGGFAPGRFVDMQQTIFMHNIHLPDVLVREIIYRWIVQREVCILVVAQPVSTHDLVDEIHEVLPGTWYLETPYTSYEEVPRDPDGFPGYPEEYKVLSIMDGHGLYLRLD